jgi:thioredoxin 1
VNPAQTIDRSTFSDSWVICLCAQWCGQCRDYELIFQQVARNLTDTHFAWLDIEDHADAIGDIDIETFPTLLVAKGGDVCFFGPLTPQATVLTRMIQTSLAATLPPPVVSQNADAAHVWQALQSDPAWLGSLELKPVRAS